MTPSLRTGLLTIHRALCGIGLLLGLTLSGSSGHAASNAPRFKVGVARTVITPALEGPMAGYYFDRSPEGVHDDLAAKAMVIDDGKNVIALVVCDLISMPREAVLDARERIGRRIGLPGQNVMISATHTHTAVGLSKEYVKSLGPLIADSVVTAYKRRVPAHLKVAMGEDNSLPHNRRYRLKDGTVMTNPGFLNPEVVSSVGPIDPRVPVVYAEDVHGRPIVTWVNYALHLDTVGGRWVSADFPHFLARLLAKVKGPDMLTIFTIGAAGDINHWDVKRPGPQRGFEEAQRIGEVLAGAVIKAYTKLEPMEPPAVGAIATKLSLPVPRFDPQQVEEARKVLAKPPRTDVDFELSRVKAKKIAAVADRQFKPIETEVQVLKVGQVAFVSAPGEYFVELGLQLQKESPFRHTIIVEQANDSVGYIPTKPSYAHGAYEDTSTRLAEGGGEEITRTGLELLRKLSAKARHASKGAPSDHGVTVSNATK